MHIRFAFILFFLGIIIIQGCDFSISSKNRSQEIKYENGKIKKKIIRLSNDTVDVKCVEYYENGQIKSEYFLKNGLLEGNKKNYYENGKLDFEGSWYKGKKKGFFKYYDSSGYVSRMVEFLPFRDTITKPNQMIRFRANGDTIVSESNYFEFYHTRDTIKLGKDSFTFKFVLKGKVYKNAYFSICNMDSIYNVKSKDPCPMLAMDNYEIVLSPTRYDLGENVLRGYITNTEYPISSQGTLKGKYAEYFFEIKFYVIE